MPGKNKVALAVKLSKHYQTMLIIKGHHHGEGFQDFSRIQDFAADFP